MGIPLNAPDQSVDLNTLHVIQLLDGVLDLPLVCLDVDDKNQGVILLNFLHGGLGIERMDDDLILVQSWGVGNRLAGVLWRTGEGLGLWSVEGGGGSDLLVNLRVSSLQCSLLRLSGLFCSGGLGTWGNQGALCQRCWV